MYDNVVVSIICVRVCIMLFSLSIKIIYQFWNFGILQDQYLLLFLLCTLGWTRCLI